MIYREERFSDDCRLAGSTKLTSYGWGYTGADPFDDRCRSPTMAVWQMEKSRVCCEDIDRLSGALVVPSAAINEVKVNVPH
jgi:hypothetical protein